MYEELVKSLREHAEWDKAGIWVIPNTIIYDLIKAADAIEELSRDLDSMNEANIALYGALPKWIPVTEKLPEKEDEAVIVWEKQGFALIDWRHDNKWAILDNNCGIATHWMQLPEPPKECE